MKKIFILLGLLLAVFLQFGAQLQRDMQKGTEIGIKKGSVLVYGVDFYGTAYDFIVEVKSIGDDGSLEFGYKMTNASATTGTVSISAAAMKEASSQFNFFSGGQVQLDDKTSVWISKSVFDQFTGADATATISTDGGRTQTKFKADKVGYDYSVRNAVTGKDNKDIAYFHAGSENGKQQYWIHYNTNNRLILKMDLGWKIWLKEIR